MREETKVGPQARPENFESLEEQIVFAIIEYVRKKDNH